MFSLAIDGTEIARLLLTGISSVEALRAFSPEKNRAAEVLVFALLWGDRITRESFAL